MFLPRFVRMVVAACAVAVSLCIGSLAEGATVGATGALRSFTARDLVALDRLSDPQVAPNGSAVIYDVRSADVATNRARHALWMLPLEPAGIPVQFLTNATDARWSPDGKYVYFLRAGSGTQQLWRISRAGGAATQITQLPLSIGAYRIAPDGVHVVISLAVFADCPTLACTKSRVAARAQSHATGTVFTKLFIRHWDMWANGTRNHLFAVVLGPHGKATGNPVSLMGSFDGDAPSKPFGGDEDFAISPDSRSVVFSARLAGSTEPWSTNFDLYSVPIDGSTAIADLTAPNPAADTGPVFSPDGAHLAYRAQKRAGFEADRFGIMVRDLRTGTTREIDPTWDRSASEVVWSHDGRTIFTSADDAGNHRIFAIDVASGAVRPLTRDGDVESFALAPNALVYAESSLTSPAQLFTPTLPSGVARQVTHLNAERLRNVALAPSKTFTFVGWNGERVQGRVTEPYGRVSGKTYPVAFLIHGGPQGSWTDGWSYRWNPQFYAGLGYAVVTVDFHGSTGYGQRFTDAISRHWGDRPFEDLQKGWTAALAEFPYLDRNRACALGASYGGYMIDWIAGNWSAPWKCLVVHDGVFDNRMMGYSTEELWFSQWENGGTPWDHPADYERFNPIDHVAAWKDPMLVIHSAQDFRIPMEQGIGAFTALQRKGIPSEFLTFPDENHWVLKPQNSLEWHDTVAAWLKRWLQEGSPAPDYGRTSATRR
jgi:dipeptidyl aminopeptidase/acylaminoacyl peptidase